jgi:hypothetical protein
LLDVGGDWIAAYLVKMAFDHRGEVGLVVASHETAGINSITNGGDHY